MLELRKEGLTNKQIAQEIGCGVSTVYENIGKRSMDVRKAAEQNKPCPVPEEKKPEPAKVEIPVVVETKPIEDKTGSKLTETDYSTANAAMAAIKANVDSWAKEPVANETPKRKLGTLSIRKEVRILELDGVACNYRVNTGTGDIELVSFDDRASLVEGLLDKSNLDAMIGELQMIRTLL
jgi:transposase